MVKIQIDLTDEEDRLVEVYKAKDRIETKELAVKKMIQTFTECKHDFEQLEKRRYTDRLKLSSYLRIVERCKICGYVRKDDIRL